MGSVPPLRLVHHSLAVSARTPRCPSLLRDARIRRLSDLSLSRFRARSSSVLLRDHARAFDPFARQPTKQASALPPLGIEQPLLLLLWIRHIDKGEMLPSSWARTLRGPSEISLVRPLARPPSHSFSIGMSLPSSGQSARAWLDAYEACDAVLLRMLGNIELSKERIQTRLTLCKAEYDKLAPALSAFTLNITLRRFEQVESLALQYIDKPAVGACRPPIPA